MRMVIILISISALAAGMVVVFYPDRVIEFQRKFYLLINWRMEPVDMLREIINTRIMGVFLIVCVVALFCYTFIRGILP